MSNDTLKQHGGARPRAGRKPVEEPRKAHSIKFTDKEWEELQDRAKKADMSVSEYVRMKTLE